MCPTSTPLWAIGMMYPTLNVTFYKTITILTPSGNLCDFPKHFHSLDNWKIVTYLHTLQLIEMLLISIKNYIYIFLNLEKKYCLKGKKPFVFILSKFVIQFLGYLRNWWYQEMGPKLQFFIQSVVIDVYSILGAILLPDLFLRRKYFFEKILTPL